MQRTALAWAPQVSHHAVVRKWTVPRALLRNVETRTLLILASVTAGVWAFSELADEVFEGDTRSFDERILLALRNPADLSDPIGPPWIEELCRDLTALGGVAVLTLAGVAVAGFLLLDGKKRWAALVASAMAGGVLLTTLFKGMFDRPRPDLVPHESYVVTSSFPSGHSTMAAVAYLTAAALLCRLYDRMRLKAYLIGWAVLLTLAIGFSRVYVGVHWPTDVLAGWTLGAVWALCCWWVVGKLAGTPAPSAEP